MAQIEYFRLHSLPVARGSNADPFWFSPVFFLGVIKCVYNEHPTQKRSAFLNSG